MYFFPSHEHVFKMYGDEGLVGDFDGDMKADLATYSYGGWWRIDYARDGLGSNRDGDAKVFLVEGPYSQVQAADFDGDGKDDFCALGANAGSNPTPFRVAYAANGFSNWDVSIFGYGYPGSGMVYSRMAPGDFDGDGKADISITDTNGRWRVDFSSNGFGYLDMQFNGGYIGGSARPVAGDFDLDGKDDLALKIDDGRWDIDYSGNGYGRIDWEVRYPGIGPSSAVHSSAGDLDGDGKADFQFDFYSNFYYGCGAICNERRVDYAWSGLGGYEPRENFGPFLSRLANTQRHAHRYFVRQLYLDHFNREPEQGGWDAWSNYIGQCGSDLGCAHGRRITTARGFLESAEFRRDKPALTYQGTPEYNHEYVRQCYLVFLRREPESSGHTAWLNYINSSGDYDTLVHGFIDSSEYAARDGGVRP